MPSTSKNQQTAMRIAGAIKAGKVKPKPGTPSAKIADSMSAAKIGDFTGPVKPSKKSNIW